MQNFSLKCFGVGDGWPCVDRNHSSFLYQFGTTSILIDCGESVSRSYKMSGARYDAIDRIFLSHLHADHFAGFFMLLQSFWLEGRRKALRVHLPADGIKPLRQMLNAAYLFSELPRFRLQFLPLRAKKPVQTAKVSITAFSTSHLEQMRVVFQKKYRQKFISYCFLLEAGRLRIGHSADIGKPEDLAPLLAKPLDLLVCELAHPKPRELFSYLQRHEVERVVFVHLARPYWANLKETRRLAARLLPNASHIFARDGQEICL